MSKFDFFNQIGVERMLVFLSCENSDIVQKVLHGGCVWGIPYGFIICSSSLITETVLQYLKLPCFRY